MNNSDMLLPLLKLYNVYEFSFPLYTVFVNDSFIGLSLWFHYDLPIITLLNIVGYWCDAFINSFFNVDVYIHNFHFTVTLMLLWILSNILF